MFQPSVILFWQSHDSMLMVAGVHQSSASPIFSPTPDFLVFSIAFVCLNTVPCNLTEIVYLS